jgi:hypothetical protein
MKRLFIRVCCLWALLGMLLTAPLVPVFAGVPPRPVHGLWVWKSPTVLDAPQGAKALRDFCKSADVNEVYLSVSENTMESEESHLASLIALLHSSSIRVEALLSSTDADESGKHRDTLLSHVESVVRFNRRHSPDRFDGIHLDIEPWQRPENKGAGNLQFLPGLVETYRAVITLAGPAGMTVNADIQGKLLKGDLGQREALLSSLPRFTLMLYELSNPQDGKSTAQKAGQVEISSQKYLAMAYDGLKDVNKTKMVIALRTADYDNLLPQMLRKIEDANRTNFHFLGWASHSYNDTLKPNR